MLKLGHLLCLGLVGATLQLGCRDNTPPVPRVPPPAPGADTPNVNYEPIKPMPGPGLQTAAAPQPFVDPPLLQDQPAETQRFLQVYQQVGKPRILVFVNRTLEGQILAAGGGDPARPGDTDEAGAKVIDYGMMEMLLTDWISVGNQVAMVPPLTSQKPLTEQQAKAVQAGTQRSMQEVAAQLDADVLIHLQARVTRQTPSGLSIRILAEAINTRGADSLARAAVDMDPPLDKAHLNTYTRFLARKLMDGMATTWSQPPAPRNSPPPPPAGTPGAAPATPPANPNPAPGGLGPRLQ